MRCHFDASATMDDDDEGDPIEALKWLGRLNMITLLSPLGRLINRSARQASRRKGA